ncbi:MAG: hypothetical protein EB072_16225 [Betaproteobacteria bacterium]|nr:hypothetical protein [Betaproteobacteria bacterium]
MPVKPANLADPVVTFQTSLGIIETELMPSKAPVTVANFLRYVGAGFYDNVIFHRLYKPTGSPPAIVAQAGLLATDGNGSYSIKSPLAAAISLESQNGLSNTLGALAMARTSEPNSAAAQFYFNTANNAANFDYQSSTKKLLTPAALARLPISRRKTSSSSPHALLSISAAHGPITASRSPPATCWSRRSRASRHRPRCSTSTACSSRTNRWASMR